VALALPFDAARCRRLVFLEHRPPSHQGRTTPGGSWCAKTLKAVTIPFTVGGGIAAWRGITALTRAVPPTR